LILASKAGLQTELFGFLLLVIMTPMIFGPFRESSYCQRLEIPSRWQPN
jgi:hypothetical protein